jgi:hypothetical protein
VWQGAKRARGYERICTYNNQEEREPKEKHPE